VNRTDGSSVTLPAGGRGVDQNGDGSIELTEGIQPAGPPRLINFRDGSRQTVIDLMQLVRVIETGGMDVDGDGVSDLDPKRIYYFGISFGGIYGPILMAIEPAVRAGVANAGGGSIIEVARLGGFRSIPAVQLATRTPSLLNLANTAPPALGFDENTPLRNQPALINKVAGAIAIQDFFERWEWAGMSGDALGYARHVRKAPLPGVPPKPIIVQFSKGDRVVPNPTTTALLRAGGLAANTMYFRNDLALAQEPTLPQDPHPFLSRVAALPSARPAVLAQLQIALFFEFDGAHLFDTDSGDVLLEVPITGPLPEELNFAQ
jgi:hypothetical protein